MTMALLAALPVLACAQSPTEVSGRSSAAVDPVAVLVGRLDLESYKATIKGLTQFGDRREGTDRNRAAIDWIEAQLKKYGCTNTERMAYVYEPPVPPAQPTRRGCDAERGHCQWRDACGGRWFAPARRYTVGCSKQQSGVADGSRTTCPECSSTDPWTTRAGLLHESRYHASGRDVHHRRPHGWSWLRRSSE